MALGVRIFLCSMIFMQHELGFITHIPSRESPAPALNLCSMTVMQRELLLEELTCTCVRHQIQ